MRDHARVLKDWSSYATDVAQRSILFWDTIRRRGNQYLEHERAGKPPVLVYDYEMVVDGRTLTRPVNYALVRILPPKGIEVDESLRPYIIVDPRAGHGPGIGGFKQDSQVGVALRAGYPVDFVIFFPTRCRVRPYGTSSWPRHVSSRRSQHAIRTARSP
jgi:hypothetical protein